MLQEQLNYLFDETHGLGDVYICISSGFSEQLHTQDLKSLAALKTAQLSV